MIPTTKKNNAALPPFLTGICKNPYVLLGVLCALLTPFLYRASFAPVYLYACIGVVLVLCGIAVILHRKGTLTTEHIVGLLFLIAMLLRILYVLRFGHDERQHDTGIYTNTWGHIGYIKYFLENNFMVPYYDPRLVFAFYNPPLHHFLCALYLKCITLFDRGLDFYYLAEAAQVLALFYSLCTTVVGLKIAKALGLQDTSYLLASIVIIFHPTSTIFAGSINNDNLCFLLVVCTIYRTILWYQDSTTKNIVFAALCMGFSLLAKTSAVYIALGLAVLFLYQFFKEKQWKKYISQYALFAVIAIPIGLSWALRCYILFDMPFSYIPDLGIYSGQYLGTGLNRLFDFSAAQWVVPFASLATTNIFVSILKYSVFGEWVITSIYTDETVVPVVLLIAANIVLVLNIALIAVSLCASIFVCFFQKSKQAILKICLAVIYLTTLITYFIFCFAHPQLCTTDFRYIPVTFFIGALALGAALPPKKALRNLMFSLTGAWAFACTVYYCILLVV